MTTDVRTAVLVAEGSSDACLVRVLEWLLKECDPAPRVWRVEFATRRLREMVPENPHGGLAAKVYAALAAAPCDLLFVHRDADNAGRGVRVNEIADAVRLVNPAKPHVPVVPVRETEAWLLVDERAIRNAASNPNGTNVIDLPPVRKIEGISDPKSCLLQALRDASQLGGRHLKRFDAEVCRARVVDHMASFEPLRKLQAFRDLEADLSRVLPTI